MIRRRSSTGVPEEAPRCQEASAKGTNQDQGFLKFTKCTLPIDQSIKQTNKLCVCIYIYIYISIYRYIAISLYRYIYLSINLSIDLPPEGWSGRSSRAAPWRPLAV